MRRNDSIHKCSHCWRSLIAVGRERSCSPRDIYKYVDQNGNVHYGDRPTRSEPTEAAPGDDSYPAAPAPTLPCRQQIDRGLAYTRRPRTKSATSKLAKVKKPRTRPKPCAERRRPCAAKCEENRSRLRNSYDAGTDACIKRGRRTASAYTSTSRGTQRCATEPRAKNWSTEYCG